MLNNTAYQTQTKQKTTSFLFFLIFFWLVASFNFKPGQAYINSAQKMGFQLKLFGVEKREHDKKNICEFNRKQSKVKRPKTLSDLRVYVWGLENCVKEFW